MHFHLLSRMLFHNHRRVFVNTEHISLTKTTPEQNLNSSCSQLLFAHVGYFLFYWLQLKGAVTSWPQGSPSKAAVTMSTECIRHTALSRHCLLTESRDLCLVNAETDVSDVWILDIDCPAYLSEQMCGNSMSRVKYYWPLFQAIVQTQRGWERWGEFMISHTFICLVQWSPMPFWSLYRQKNKYSDVGWLHHLEKSIWLGSSWCFVLWNGSGPSKDSLFFTQPLQVLIATWKHCEIAIEKKSGMTILRKFLKVAHCRAAQWKVNLKCSYLCHAKCSEITPEGKLWQPY